MRFADLDKQQIFGVLEETVKEDGLAVALSGLPDKFIQAVFLLAVQINFEVASALCGHADASQSPFREAEFKNGHRSMRALVDIDANKLMVEAKLQDVDQAELLHELMVLDPKRLLIVASHFDQHL